MSDRIPDNPPTIYANFTSTCQRCKEIVETIDGQQQRHRCVDGALRFITPEETP